MSDRCRCGFAPPTHDHADDSGAVLKLVTVALPEPDSTRYEGDEHEPADRLAWRSANWAASVWKYPEVQLSAVFDSGWETFEPFSIAEARSLAAALLAAADAADALNTCTQPAAGSTNEAGPRR